MKRVFSCEGPDAKMEVYIPVTASGNGPHNARLEQLVTGAYALDLTGVDKGKILESVRVQFTRDRMAVTVRQYTRGLPATEIPVAGGTVDFDQRFATQAKCGPFNIE